MELLFNIFISWAPMAILIGVWVYFMRRKSRQGQYLDLSREYMTEHIAETKRLNANLERIASSLESKTMAKNA